MIHTLILDTDKSTVSILNGKRSNFRFENIPFRQLIGDEEYDKYDYFNFNLIEARFDRLASQLTTNQDDAAFNIVLSGANNLNQLVNSTYKNEMILCSIVFPNLNFDDQTIIRFSNETKFTIMKNPNLQIEMKYTDFATGQIKDPTYVYPDLALTFKITGIPKDDDEKY